MSEYTRRSLPCLTENLTCQTYSRATCTSERSFCFFLLFFAASCISPPYQQFLLLQHVPTVLAAVGGTIKCRMDIHVRRMAIKQGRSEGECTLTAAR